MEREKRTIASPTMKMNPDAKNHPLSMSIRSSSHQIGIIPLTQTIPTGPAGIEYDNVEAIDGKSPIILKAMPKTSIIVKLRRSSCLYPSFAGSIVRQASSHSVGDCPYPRRPHHPRSPDRT